MYSQNTKKYFFWNKSILLVISKLFIFVSKDITPHQDPKGFLNITLKEEENAVFIHKKGGVLEQLA